MLYFGKDRAESLHPDLFDCSMCERPEKDTARGCPKCELIEKFNRYSADAVQGVIRFAGAFPKGWTLDSLIKLHGQVAGVLQASKGRIKRRWDVRLARLARIYLEQQKHAKAVADFEYMRSLETQSQAQRGGLVAITGKVRR